MNTLARFCTDRPGLGWLLIVLLSVRRRVDFLAQG